VSCRTALATLVLLIAPMLAPAAWAQAGPRALFIRGADRSGGFLEAGSDASRTEHLADINNTATSNGNHGWYEFAETLRAAGFTVEQVTESVEPGNTSGQSEGRPVEFDVMDLTPYDVLVFGSNNAVYTTGQVDAVELHPRRRRGRLHQRRPLRHE
jgi:hypothetical protein